MALVVDVNWSVVDTDTDGSDVEVPVEYDFIDSENNVFNGLSSSQRDAVPVPGVTYGDIYTANVTARAMGYDSSMQGSASIRLNSRPVVTADPAVRMQSSAANPAEVTFSMTATDEVPAAIVWSLQGLPGGIWSVADNGVVNGLATALVTLSRPVGGWGDAGATYSIVVRALDQYSLAGTATVELRIVNFGPEIDPNQTFEVEQSGNLPVELGDLVEDPEGDPIVYAVTQGLSPTTGGIIISGSVMTIAITAFAATGLYPFQISATAGGDTVLSSGWRVRVVTQRLQLREPDGFSFGFRDA